MKLIDVRPTTICCNQTSNIVEVFSSIKNVILVFMVEITIKCEEENKVKSKANNISISCLYFINFSIMNYL